MSRNLFLGLIAVSLVIGSILLSLYARMLKPTAPLHASPATISFGSVRPGSQSHSSLTLTNMSALPIRIVKVISGCSCAQLRITHSRLASGEASDAHIAFTAGTVLGESQAAVDILYTLEDANAMMRLHLELGALVSND